MIGPDVVWSVAHAMIGRWRERCPCEVGRFGAVSSHVLALVTVVALALVGVAGGVSRGGRCGGGCDVAVRAVGAHACALDSRPVRTRPTTV